MEHFKAMAGIKTLTSLELQSFPREPETFVILTPLSKLESVHFSTSIKAEQLSGLETFKNLNRVVLNLDNVTDDAEQVAAKLALCRSLETVDLLTGTPDNEKFIKTAEVIQKALSKVKVVLRRP